MSHYGIPGGLKVPELAKRVKWLLKRGNFKNGSIDLEAETFDRGKIFNHPLITEIILQQWFSNAKSDVWARNEMVKQKRIFPSVIVLVITCIESCLMAWSLGKETKHNFSEDNCSERYHFFMKAYESLQKNAPDHVNNLEEEMFIYVMKYKHMGVSVEEEVEDAVEDESHGVNFAALNAAAASRHASHSSTA
ncbi:unnamed protein product [Cyclocybe aegerita]|uniref:DUF6532 domain-containing protein n=1 Tax=Cyclocybe aegerita TaxID=1973307 RepID=A0A8S0VQP3_CYCAE|nr:unnamed protein product [Cyclocybe aegerita]